jgi:hypothetical protein
MALLSKKHKFSRISSGHTYQRLSDTVFGCKKPKLNKEDEVFSNDYIYSYTEDDGDDDDGSIFDDKEVGINKNFAWFSEESDNDDYKNLNAKKERRETLEFEDYLRAIRTKFRG